MTNTLYYGDNLDILRQHVPDESVDLIYLDPPFNSNASYNVLFKERSGEESPAQIKAFTDTWEWTQESERVFEQEIIMHPATPPNVKDMITAFREFIGRNAMMAYLVMMTPRLVELRRVLKPTGSIYLHCDPTASHYLKLLMDAIYGARYFRSEISWRRTNAHNDAKQGRRQYGNVRDSILFYSKGNRWNWNWQYTEYDKEYVDAFYKFMEQGSGRLYQKGDLTAAKPGGDTSYEWRVKRPRGEDWEADLTNEYLHPIEGWEYKGVLPYSGRYWAYSRDGMTVMAEEGRIAYNRNGTPRYKRYLDEMPGVPLQNDWTDIRPASPSESLGYQTQKPQALLERIIEASSNEGDVVLDPFCGCGTAVAAAEKLKRKWIGVDVTHLAVALMKNRLKTGFNIVPGVDYQVVGEPADVGSALALAEQDRYQFQFWAMSLLEAFPREQSKRGADRGIDGVIHFIDGPRRSTRKAVVQVKSGKVSSPLIRDLKGTVDRENAALGLFITLEDPTRDMRTEAVSAGFYHSEVWQRDYPKVQIRTVQDLLTGNTFDLPPHPSMYQPAQRVRRPEGKQSTLEEAG
ncbi:MAG: DNA methyltransferase [Chloroflexota bacterium]|nr:DNA methyltransferase [Chloroflexota bacterium]